MRLLALMVLAALTVSGCGASDSQSNDTKLPSVVEGAKQPKLADFPKPDGRTMKQLAATIPDGPHASEATSVFLPGKQRLAFGLIDNGRKFVYGETAVYIAPTFNDKVRGPYLSPLDSIVPAGPYLSRSTAADESAIKAIYSADVPLTRPGPLAVLIVNRRGDRIQRSLLGVKVLKSSPIPNVGDRPPKIDTPTTASVGGDIASIDTRIPPDSMHDVNFRDVIGKKPVALLFATPQLCQSRICGPVTDLAEQLKARYGKAMTFIHQEVYRNNNFSDGMRPQLKAFDLKTEPWFFTFDRHGRVAARLEGSFGLHAMGQAIDAALRDGS